MKKKAIKKRFYTISKEHPDWNSLIIFIHTIYGQKVSSQVIAEQFIKLVNVDDYDYREGKAILSFLTKLSYKKEKVMKD